MIRYECDQCGRVLGANDPQRYIVKIEVYAAAGPVELSPRDLVGDLRAEMERLVEALHSADPDEVEDQTYRCLQFDLCQDCQRKFLRQPLVDRHG
ncbi:MAG TPA: hypothetical protein VGM03_23105 [Phycisphaerae bacterium]